MYPLHVLEQGWKMSGDFLSLYSYQHHHSLRIVSIKDPKTPNTLVSVEVCCLCRPCLGWGTKPKHLGWTDTAQCFTVDNGNSHIKVGDLWQ